MVGYFQQKQIDSPRLSAELLLSHVLGLQRIQLYTDFEKMVERPKLDKLRKLVKRAADHEPIQYLVGKTEFYSLTLDVNKNCLIPRPETELLVERAIEFLRKRGGKNDVCDLCTGSGCVAVAVAKNVDKVKVIATDICDKALTVAAGNVEKYNLGKKIQLLRGDLFEPIIKHLDETKFDLITCNPPYVSRSEYENLPENVKKHEPKHALSGGEDGLDCYKKLARQIDKHLKNEAAAILEIGSQQAKEVSEILTKTACFKEINIEKDHLGNDRLLYAKK